MAAGGSLAHTCNHRRPTAGKDNETAGVEGCNKAVGASGGEEASGKISGGAGGGKCDQSYARQRLAAVVSQFEVSGVRVLVAEV